MQKMAYDLDEENFILKEELSELKAQLLQIKKF